MSIPNTQRGIDDNPLYWENKSKSKPHNNKNLQKGDYNDEKNHEWEEDDDDDEFIADLFIFKI